VAAVLSNVVNNLPAVLVLLLVVAVVALWAGIRADRGQPTF
jgi:Na+/H+ antiporter NhaD/arsenite permease-like protein